MKKLDPQTASLIKSARHLKFSDAPIPLKRNLFVYRTAGNSYVVQMSIAGSQVVLAYIDDYQSALRFADMASLRFQRYRKGPPKYNYSEAQATYDTQNEEENGGALANFLLARLAVAFGDFLNDTQPKQKLCAPSSPAKLSLDERLDALELRITNLDNEAIKYLQDRLTNSLANLETRLANLEALTEITTPIYDNIEKPTPAPVTIWKP